MRDYAAPSVFQPGHLLREARRQKGLPDQDVPGFCVLDPDGDLVRHLHRTGQSRPHPGWACYHTDLTEFSLPGGTVAGVVGCAVGASFAVLVAEQLFASGCQMLLSITSAGQIGELGALPALVLIDRALRDEGTSLHYLPASPAIDAPDTALLDRAEAALRAEFAGVHRGMSWTTDAPYRETAAAIAHARAEGALAVEMEAAALYALATAKQLPILCVAHVTNTMGQQEGDDFEKGEAGGSVTALRVIAVMAGLNSRTAANLMR